MFLEAIRSEGLSHLSYIIGNGRQAAVIDPRRDCGIYVDIAHRNGARITSIFETHRNEDYVIGSQELARRTGAAIYHGKALSFAYGNPVSEGDRFDLGGLILSVLETPGHTYESISIAVQDPAFSDEAVGVFTGDALFVGDVGRTDFFPEEQEKMAGLLYDSIFQKLLPLGDHVILYPAHGAGSVCGGGIAAREFSTLGYERRHNPALQCTDRAAFVARKAGERHYRTPYFRKMEQLNLHGNAPEMPSVPQPAPMSVTAFAEAMSGGMVAIDVRSPEGFAGAFIPGSIAMPLDMVPAYAGWFLTYGEPIGIVAGTGAYGQVETRPATSFVWGSIPLPGRSRAACATGKRPHATLTASRPCTWRCFASASQKTTISRCLTCAQRRNSRRNTSGAPCTCTSATCRIAWTKFRATGRSSPFAAAGAGPSSRLPS